MADPAPGVVYTLDHQAGRWVAPGRDWLPALRGWQLGVTRPTRDNIGVTMGGYPVPTEVLGDGGPSILYIEAGQVVEDKIVRQLVRIRPGGVLRRCVVAGPDQVVDASIPMVLATGGTWTGSNPALVEECTFAPGMYAPEALRQGFAACVGGNRYMARYCVATGARDAFETHGLDQATWARIEACWSGEMMHLAPDDYTGKPDTHNDCYQDYGSTRTDLPIGAVTILGSTLEATRHPLSDPLVAPDRQSMTAVRLSKSGGNHTAILLERCWLVGGQQTINAVPGTPPGTMRLSVQGCRLDRGTADGGSPSVGTDGIAMPHVAAYVGSYVDLSWGDVEPNSWADGSGVAQPIIQRA